MTDRTLPFDSENVKWKPIYLAAGIALAIFVAFIPAQIVVFIVNPPPTTIVGWFTLLHDNPLVGLLDMDLLIVIENVLMVPIFLALYVALRRHGEAIMTVATVLGFVGLAAYLSSNTALAMLSLSDKYAAATTDAQRALLEAAGQATMATYTGTAFHANYILGSLVVIVICMVMLRSPAFGKATAYAGILANVVALGLYLPTIGLGLAVLSAVILWIWYILMARTFIRMSRGAFARRAT